MDNITFLTNFNDTNTLNALATPTEDLVAALIVFVFAFVSFFAALTTAILTCTSKKLTKQMKIIFIG
jgi:hypothetical protein